MQAGCSASAAATATSHLYQVAITLSFRRQDTTQLAPSWLVQCSALEYVTILKTKRFTLHRDGIGLATYHASDVRRRPLRRNVDVHLEVLVGLEIDGAQLPAQDDWHRAHGALYEPAALGYVRDDLEDGGALLD